MSGAVLSAARVRDSIELARGVVAEVNTVLDELDRVWKAANKRDADTDAAVKRIQQQAKKTA